MRKARTLSFYQEWEEWKCSYWERKFLIQQASWKYILYIYCNAMVGAFSTPWFNNINDAVDAAECFLDRMLRNYKWNDIELNAKA